MKKLLKQVIYVFSFTVLMVLVFSNNILGKLDKEEGGNQKNKNLPPEGLFSAFGTQKAFADAPAPPTGGGGDGGGNNAGCSSDGAGCSACGDAGGDGGGGDGCCCSK